MAVRSGYKQTEVGVIPEDWEVWLLRDVVDFTNGKPHEGNVKSDGRYWLITLDSIGIDGRLKAEHKRTNIFDSSLRRNDIVSVLSDIAHGNLLGLCDLIPADGSYVLNQRMGRLRLKVPAVASFVRLQINRRQDHFRKRGQGTSQKHVYRRDFDILPIPFPAPREQEAIAEALSDADAFIESLEQLLAKKRQLKQGAMQQLLTGKKRLPGFSGEWAMYSLGGIADPNQRWSFTGGPFGSNLKSSDYTDVGVRIIQLQNIGDGKFKDDYEVYTSRQKADELLSCNIYPGEIILSKMGDPVARACIVPLFQDRYVMCSDGIRLAVDKKCFNAYFVYTQINAPAFRGNAANAGTGSTRKRIGLTELKGLELCCPSLPEQTAIAAILSDMDDEIAALEAKLAKSRQLKQGMMQKLLTGRIRLVRPSQRKGSSPC